MAGDCAGIRCFFLVGCDAWQYFVVASVTAVMPFVIGLGAKVAGKRVV